MTSMIDVIFLLLIFFMLNVGFHQAEREMESGIQTQSRSRARRHLEPVIVRIAPGGGGHVYRIGGRDLATPEELADVLRLMGRADGAFVRVPDDAPFAMAAAAIQACYDAGFLAVSYVPEAPGA
jgi:biopolymer transport protein ExbD